MNVVAITYSTYTNVNEKIELAIQRAGGLDIKNGDHITIKINLCDFKMPETGAITHPSFIQAVLRYLRSTYERLHISVVESDATVARPDLLMRWLGFEQIWRRYDVKWVNLTKDKWIKKRIDGRYFTQMHIPKTIVDSDYLISTAKLKTSLVTKISCCLKNQFGCIPFPKKEKFHPVLDDVIVDACSAMKPNFCLVDGIVAMGGTKGPNEGIPIQANVIVSGKDPVSVDAACAKILGFNPYSIGHIRKAEASGIGKISHNLVGEYEAIREIDFMYNRWYAQVLIFAISLKSRARRG
jgi:uncharacterized protein (DUF362 family)